MFLDLLVDVYIHLSFLQLHTSLRVTGLLVKVNVDNANVTGFIFSLLKVKTMIWIEGGLISG